MVKAELKKALGAGLWLTMAVYIVNIAASYLNVTVKELFGVTGYTPLTGTLGNTILGYLQGLVSFDVGAIFAIYLSSVAIYFIGFYLYGMVNIPKTSSDWGRLTAVLAYGTIPFYILFVGANIPAVNVLIGAVIYLAVVAVSASLMKGFASKVI